MKKLIVILFTLLLVGCSVGGSINAGGGSSGVGVGIGLGTGIKF